MGHALGYETNGELTAGVLYTDWNGRALQIHVAAKPGKHWLHPEFLFTVFWYPFEQLGAAKLLGPIAENNAACRRFVTHLGFVLEATLKDAHPGGDLLIYSMTRAQCRWLLREKANGKAECTAASRLQSCS
jgi:RimJ/RimL family protein N-acetyltransferase